ncbi:hypothetical protein Ae406Ps2_5614 [Pseudonocardia sp. Ae406_Ps2]|nr:hypothetical protein Ae406Ps2_5614 [Pseudonocardia sp. Ae406_Ps2]
MGAAERGRSVEWGRLNRWASVRTDLSPAGGAASGTMPDPGQDATTLAARNVSPGMARRTFQVIAIGLRPSWDT